MTSILNCVDGLSKSVTTIQNIFDCPICLDMLKDPVRTTSCGHTFCKMCISMVLRKHTKQPCPICKTLLSNRNIIEDEKVSVFLELVLELISAINNDVGVDVTSHFRKPISTNEASQDSDEFFKKKPHLEIVDKLSCVNPKESLAEESLRGKRNKNRSIPEFEGNLENHVTNEKDLIEAAVSADEIVADFNFTKPKPYKRKSFERNRSIISHENEGELVETKSSSKQNTLNERDTEPPNSDTKNVVQVTNEVKSFQKHGNNPAQTSQSLLENKMITSLASSSNTVKNTEKSECSKSHSKTNNLNLKPRVSTRSTKKIELSSHKKPVDRSARFYITKSVVMKRIGKRPIIVLRRKYPVTVRSNSKKGKSTKFSKRKMPSESSKKISIGNSNTRKSYTSVSIQTSPVKVLEKLCHHSKTEENYADIQKRLENVGEEEINQDTCSNDSDKHDEMSKSNSNDVIEEDMDIFGASDILPAEFPKENEISHNQNEIDTSLVLTQPNPNIKNRNNICKRKSFTPKSENSNSSKNQLFSSNNQQQDPNDEEIFSELTQPNPNIKNRDNICRRESFTPKSKNSKSIKTFFSSSNNQQQETDSNEVFSELQPNLNIRNKEIICRREISISRTAELKSPLEDSEYKTSKTKMNQKKPNTTNEGSTPREKYQNKTNVDENLTSNYAGHVTNVDKRKKTKKSFDNSNIMSQKKSTKNMSNAIVTSGAQDNQQLNALEEKTDEETIMIDSSDDEVSEISATPTKNQPCESLTQSMVMNSSKLEKSIIDSQSSIIQSTLEVQPVSRLRSAIQSSASSAQKNKSLENAIGGVGLANESKNTQKSVDSTVVGSGKQMMKKKNYSFTYSRLTEVHFNILKGFSELLDAEITGNITDNTTHVIILPKEGNKAPHTFKYLKGVAKKLWIVSFEWVSSSLKAKKLQPEVDFVILDISGAPGPLRCKQVSELPLADFIVTAIPPYSTATHDQIRDLIVLAGAELVDNISTLKKRPADKPRVLITDGQLETELIEKYMCVYKMIPVHSAWLVAVIGQYKSPPLSPFLHLPVPREILHYL